jgi:hypothetical protein
MAAKAAARVKTAKTAKAARKAAKAAKAPKAPSPAGYSGTPLPQKLGIKPRSVVWLAGGAPGDFGRTLGALPEGARLVRRAPASAAELVVLFVPTRAALERGLPGALRGMGRDGLWIAWPKQSSGVKTDLSETVVRERGLSEGIVDFKVCAIDATWSGLKFQRRRS